MKTPSLRLLTRDKVRAAFLCFAILFGVSTGATNGATLTFAVGATNGVTNSEVVVPIRVSNFTNISSFQFSFHWNTNVASFVDVEQFGVQGMASTDFGVFATGTVTVAWFEPNASSTNLADGATVFGVRLKLIGPAAATCPVTIDGVPTALLAGDENLSSVPVTSVNSILSIDRTLIVSCSLNKTVECGSVWNFDPPFATDSCGGLPVTIDVLSTGTNFLSCGFTATRIWEIVDQCNNRTTCAQTVTAIDTTPPTPASSANKIIEYGQAWSFDAPTGTDLCSGLVSVRVSSGFTNAGPCGPTYTATCIWELMDACGNKTNCSQTVTVRDTAPPTITPAADKNVNCLMPWTFDDPTAVDLANGVVIPTITSTTTNGTCMTGFTATRIWRATDSCGNSTTAMQRVFGRAIVTVSGTVYNPTNYPPTMSEKRVAGTTLIGPTNSSATAASDGSYNLVFDAGSNVVINPIAPNVVNPADGVTSLDISFIRRHILNVASLDSPYKILTADVDGSSSVSTLDLSFIRRLVLGTTNRFPIGLWRFIPSGTVFGNVLAPWGAPTNRVYPSVGGDLSGQDFLALKLGDVNNSWTAPVGLAGDDAKSKASESADGANAFKTDGASVGSDPVIFTVPATNGLPGTEVVVPIRASSFVGIGTLQFSFHWNTNVVTFLNVEPAFGLSGMSVGGNFNLGMSNSGTLAVSWDDTTGGATTLPDGTSIFSVRFRITGAPSNTSSLTINGTPTAYEVTDGFQTLPSTAVPGQIYIDQPNRTPALANISNQSVDEQNLLSFTAIASDPDGSAQTLTFSLDSGFPTGAAINSANGSFSWTPTEAQGPGAYPITVRVTDNGSPPLSDTRTFTVTVNEVNNTPSALADAYNVTEDTTLNQTPGVLANDSDPDGNPLTAVLVANPTHGTLSLNSNGSFTYTPSLNYNGPDTFTYRATDGSLTSAVTTVTLNVAAVNDAPVAANDTYTTAEDTLLNVPLPGVLANDTDVDGNPLSAVLVTTVTHGTLSLSANGGFTYTPSSNYAGADSFTYRATDGSSTSGVTTVSITITPVNDIPVANDNQYFTLEDTRLNVPAASGILTNDFDAEGSVMTALLVSTTTNGVLILTNTGGFTYLPNTNANGVDHFTYWATDGVSTSALATVTLTVQPVNDAPVASGESHVVAEDSVLAPGASVLSNDSDVDGDTLRAVLVSGVTHGTLILNTNGLFTYTPNPNYAGADSFTYRATDGLLNSAVTTVSITVTPINDAPLAGNDGPYFVSEDNRLNVAASSGVLANDTDADGDSLTTLLVDTTVNGVLNLTNNGGFSYLPNANFNGTDQFTYRASDGIALSALVTVTLIVQTGNDAPVAVGESYEVTEDSVLTIGAPGVLGNDSDLDGDVLRAVLVSGVAHGTLNLNTNGSFVYTPSANYSGSDSFTYRATDGILNSAVTTVSITVTPVNDVPVAANDSQYFTLEDTRLNVAATSGVLTNDTDGDAEPLTALLVSTTTNGVLTLTNNGGFAYLPNTNFNGIDHFTYRVTDGVSTSSVATVTITITSVNDIPVAVNDAYTVTEDATLTVGGSGVLANDTDSDAATLTAVLVSNPEHGILTFNPNGSFSYIPAPNFYGPDFFTYRASDGTASSVAAATVSITVSPVNDPPVLATIGTKEVVVGNPLTFTASATDIDDPPQSLTFSLEGGPADASIHPVTGAFNWTPGDAEASTTNYVTIRVTDNGSPALSAAETIALVVYATPTVSIADTSIPGGSDGLLVAEFTASLSAPVTRPVSVDFATAAGSALAGNDYVATNGTVIFPPGATSAIVEVTVVGKSTVYTNRNFFVTLSNPTNGTIANATGVGTIEANPAPGFYIDDVTVAEANGGVGAPKANAVFTVTLLGGSDRLVTVSFNALGGSALLRKDFKPKKGVLKFPPGVTTQTITVPITGETMSESNEWFAVNLSRPVNAVIIHGQGRATILDDDPLPVVTISDVEMVEPNAGASAASFLVRLSAKSGRAVHVDFATADNTALANSDYVPAGGTLVFPPGMTQQRVYVNVIGNTKSENDETFSLNLGNPVNATMGNGHAVGHIRDTDKVPLVSVSDAAVDSSVSTATFTVFLTAPSERMITVNVATAHNTAQPDIDYTAVNATLTFEPGVTEKTVSVPLLKNSSAVTSCSFYLTLVGVVNTVMGDRLGICTIPVH